MGDRKMRCRQCEWLDYDFLDDVYEAVDDCMHFCGLHGRHRVDPEGPQLNLDNHGSCGFLLKKRMIQLEIPFSFDDDDHYE